MPPVKRVHGTGDRPRWHLHDFPGCRPHAVFTHRKRFTHRLFTDRYIESHQHPALAGRALSDRPFGRGRRQIETLLVTADAQLGYKVALALRLRWANSVIHTTEDAARAVQLIGDASPDVVVFQPSQPDLDLAETLDTIRSLSDVPIVVLSAVGSSLEAAQAMEWGADDYFRTSSDLLELVARVGAVIRRAGHRPSMANGTSIVSGQLSIDPDTYVVSIGAERVGLTATEFRLLCILMKNRGKVVTRAAIEQALWGEGDRPLDVVKKYVQRLRHKLDDHPRRPHWIANVHGIGYRFVGPLEDARDAQPSSL